MTKYLREDQFKERKIYFGSQFLRLQSMVTWLHCFGAVVKQNMMAGSMWLAKAFYFMVATKREGW
jgi:hypothetical protein